MLAYLNNSLIMVLAMSFLVACGYNKSEDFATDQKHKQKNRQLQESLNQKKVPQELLALAADTQQTEKLAGKNSLPEENLYGKFFDERAEFYIIEQPQNSLYRSRVKKLTLYYLDGQLSQTRYSLEEDIVNDLLQLYGSFGITGHDARNQALIREKQIVINTTNGWVFNPALDNYQISWQLNSSQIKYRVNKHEKKDRFNYLERIKTYKKAFSEIERGGAPDFKL